jgi:hypothetical protein
MVTNLLKGNVRELLVTIIALKFRFWIEQAAAGILWKTDVTVGRRYPQSGLGDRFMRRALLAPFQKAKWT